MKMDRNTNKSEDYNITNTLKLLVQDFIQKYGINKTMFDLPIEANMYSDKFDCFSLGAVIFDIELTSTSEFYSKMYSFASNYDSTPTQFFRSVRNSYMEKRQVPDPNKPNQSRTVYTPTALHRAFLDEIINMVRMKDPESAGLLQYINNKIFTEKWNRQNIYDFEKGISYIIGNIVLI